MLHTDLIVIGNAVYSANIFKGLCYAFLHRRRRIGSVILSTQIISPSEQDFESGFIELNYNTTLVPT